MGYEDKLNIKIFLIIKLSFVTYIQMRSLKETKVNFINEKIHLT